MRFPRLAMNAADSRSAGRYRWVVVWLSVGAMIAFLLIANTVRDYVFVSRLLATQQVRHQMTQIAAQVEQQLRRSELTSDTLQTALSGSERGDEAVDVRSSDGSVLQHLGPSFPDSTISMEQARAAFSQREALFRTVSTPKGDMVIEVFPLRGLRPANALSLLPSKEPRAMILEVALPLKDADPAVLKPIRRNLFINLEAAGSLLATVLLAGFGLRSFVRGVNLEEQIEIARQVQSRLLPKSTLQVPGVQIATEYRPSEHIGGDFYDVFPSKGSGIAVLIGDVSGKGIPAALLMGVIHGAVRTADWQSTSAGHEEESGRLNRLLCDQASGNRFASMFWCVYEEPLRTLRYVNAGHCPPFLIAKRDGQLITTRLDKGGPVLGLLPGATYEAATVEIAAGDLLVMHSDGLVEAANPAGEEYGDRRLGDLLGLYPTATPAKLREVVSDSLATFTGGTVLQDDLTFAIIRFGPHAAHTAQEADTPKDAMSAV